LYLNDFECDMVVGTKRDGLSDFHAELSLGFTKNDQTRRKYPVLQFGGQNCLVDSRGKLRMASLAELIEQQVT